MPIIAESAVKTQKNFHCRKNSNSKFLQYRGFFFNDFAYVCLFLALSYKLAKKKSLLSLLLTKPWPHNIWTNMVNHSCELIAMSNLEKSRVTVFKFTWIQSMLIFFCLVHQCLLIVFFFLYFSLVLRQFTAAPNVNFRKNICSEDDLRSRTFGIFFVEFLACLPLLGFLNI